jgi:hypothetical protein
MKQLLIVKLRLIIANKQVFGITKLLMTVVLSKMSLEEVGRVNKNGPLKVAHF